MKLCLSGLCAPYSGYIDVEVGEGIADVGYGALLHLLVELAEDVDLLVGQILLAGDCVGEGLFEGGEVGCEC